MSGVNKAIILGNCGQDPELKYGQSGNAFASVSIATSEKWKDKQTGQQQERTDWHNVKFFGKLAEIVGQYIKKGSKIYVEGSMHTDKWQDQNGQDRYTTYVKAAIMQMLDSRQDSQQAAPRQNYAPQAAPQGYPQQPPPPPSGGRPAHAAHGSAPPTTNYAQQFQQPNDDDDIAF